MKMITSAVMAMLPTLIAPLAWADPCHAPLPPRGATFGGAVSYIVDGDGLCVGQAEGGIEVRLSDFRAPELRQAGGREAKAALAAITSGQHVDCVALGHSYDRVVAACSIDGRALGDLMRDAGIAEGGR